MKPAATINTTHPLMRCCRHVHVLTLCAAADVVSADLSELVFVLLGSVGATAAVICDRERESRDTASVTMFQYDHE